ncbi:hypothetical protein A628_02561 [Salmonella enterica subsp. enterica serovar Cubana str. 76814]|uniref:Uncharacterized protein n=1 Tax=Salmonella enterica subsp. enterica serovar Cubana str. 76814 TaxID=1192560 RepID=V7INE2_SALET|nr:hypothetical protein A628_02561 [Salmonella enterica subsp. enterica serovar Cubana str. 76814]
MQCESGKRNKNKIIILLCSFPYLCNSVFMLCANFLCFYFHGSCQQYTLLFW